MKCPKCEKAMKEGYVTLGTTENASILWSDEEYPGVWQDVLSDFRLREKWKREILVQHNLVGSTKEQWSRKGFRCSDCRIVLLEY